MIYIKNAFMSLLLAISCQKVASDDTTVKIAGGTETNDFPGVIRFLVEKESGRFCTGVVVSDSTALLAGHCIKNSTLQNQIYAERTDRSGDPVVSKKIYFWTSVAALELLNPETIARDLAVVAFPKGTFSGPFVKIAPSTVSGARAGEKAKVTLVGFGANELGSSAGARNSLGVKRMGHNVIHSLENGYYKVRAVIGDHAPIDNAIGATGDAGAPLLDTDGYLLGIGAGLLLTSEISVGANKGSERTTDLTKDPLGYPAHAVENAQYAYNSFVDLSSEASRKLLNYAAWHGRPGTGLVVIPGFEPSEDVKLTAEDQSWIALNNKKRDGEWVAMTGGGGMIASQTSLALQASVSCSNGSSQQVNHGGSFASCSSSGGGSSGTGFGSGATNPFPKDGIFGSTGASSGVFGPQSSTPKYSPDFAQAFRTQPPMAPFPPMQPIQPFVWPSPLSGVAPGVSASATPGGFASASTSGPSGGSSVSTGGSPPLFNQNPFSGFGGPMIKSGPGFQEMFGVPQGSFGSQFDFSQFEDSFFAE